MKRDFVLTQRRWLRRGYSEAASTVLIGAGMAMLVQPFSLALFTWSFPVILVGALAFLVTSHFPE
ncbi:hypothetical protein R75461_07019 [Paraburkholderia nemoris]|uniref:hypothetical protein n=1 Tax=Paraburkholderia nemoris TaxID=2793076 RepID=UPI00190C20DA|nr:MULTISPECIES: hypothetical protein [Paraburkholderia]MBK3785258.1 hypothetical protein [Paraburkholderia aspalathi]CAE6840961.1 hypothetical protein R75461_07019 [Paraburkholderia nemoris]